MCMHLVSVSSEFHSMDSLSLTSDRWTVIHLATSLKNKLKKKDFITRKYLILFCFYSQSHIYKVYIFLTSTFLDCLRITTTYLDYVYWIQVSDPPLDAALSPSCMYYVTQNNNNVTLITDAISVL